jgi:HK97 family phage portal protein
MSSFTWRQVTHSHTLTWGNGYGYITRNAAGGVLSIQPMMPDKVKAEMVNGLPSYLYQREDGHQVPLNPGDVLHIPGLGYDGLTGYSNIQMHKEALGLGKAAENFGSTFFGNGANMGGTFTHPKSLGQQGRQTLKSGMDAYKGGGYNGTLVLEEGMTYTRIGIPPNDAQFLETRKFQTSEVARMFDIPPHMIGDMEAATFSNIAEQSIEFLRYTMMPWLIKWEQELDYKLLTDRERDQGYYFKFNVGGLLRGTQSERYASYATAINTGWMSRNEARSLEDMNDADGFDEFLVPANMLGENTAAVEPEVEPEAKSLDVFAPLIRRAAEQLLSFDTRLITDAAKKCSVMQEFQLRVNEKYATSAGDFSGRTLTALAETISEANAVDLCHVTANAAQWMQDSRNALIEGAIDVEGVGVITIEEIEAELTTLLTGDLCIN